MPADAVTASPSGASGSVTAAAACHMPRSIAWSKTRPAVSTEKPSGPASASRTFDGGTRSSTVSGSPPVTSSVSSWASSTRSIVAWSVAAKACRSRARCVASRARATRGGTSTRSKAFACGFQNRRSTVPFTSPPKAAAARAGSPIGSSER